MSRLILGLVASTLALFVFASASPARSPVPPTTAPVNPSIDMEGFLRASREAADHRAKRLVSEADFLRMSREPGTIVLDCRSKEKYDLLHIAGAINLSFPDITVDSLAKTLPDKSSRILIYCNNNFKNAEKAFPSKRFDAALNLSTYVSLYSCGYRNVYELAPLLDPATSVLPFESSVVRLDALKPGR